jgi:hypothetical protein
MAPGKSAGCLPLVTPCRPDNTFPTETLPVIPDFGVQMSGITLIPSGLPPGPDLVSDPVLRGKLTQSRHLLTVPKARLHR